MRGMTSDQRATELGLNQPSMLSRAGAGAQKFMQPMGRTLRRGLGLAALGGAGALAYGLHRQNEEDSNAHKLVYAPMQGSYMQ